MARSSLGDIKVDRSLDPCLIETFILISDFGDHLRVYFGFKVTILYITNEIYESYIEI